MHRARDHHCPEREAKIEGFRKRNREMARMYRERAKLKKIKKV